MNDKTDSLLQQLAAVEQEIKDLVKEKTRLQKKEQQGTITDGEKIDLAGAVELLEKLDASAMRYERIITLAMKNEPPVSKSFSEADPLWIKDVTGVNTDYRKWTGYVVDKTVHPGRQFKTAFENIGKAFHQSTEAGRRIYLNLILGDIILRPEFNGILRIFPELEVSVLETNGSKKRRLNGRTDYTVGFAKGKDMFDFAIPPAMHLVAVEAKTNIGDRDLWQCVAEAATLYKIRVDANKDKKSVWGILSNAKTWQFIYIDEGGLLWRSESLIMDLHTYNKSVVLLVYRIVYYIVKCCYEASIYTR
jgi:hypothetical protein